VMSANGMRVLDILDRPIALPSSESVRIDASGAILQNGTEVARLQVVRGGDAASLAKAGGNLYRLREGITLDRATTSARVRQGFTESSAVDPILALNDMMSASKAAQSNLKMMQYHDDLLGQMINTFGRVA